METERTGTFADRLAERLIDLVAAPPDVALLEPATPEAQATMAQNLFAALSQLPAHVLVGLILRERGVPDRVRQAAIIEACSRLTGRPN